MILKSIDEAANAVEVGHKKTALEELDRARNMLKIIRKALGNCVKPPFANSSCPIMGGVIEPDKVAKKLIREHKGQQVAFCCGGCPTQWDKLTDAEKDAKLSKVLIPAKKWTCPKDPQVGFAKCVKCSNCNMKLKQGAESAKPKPASSLCCPLK